MAKEKTKRLDKLMDKIAYGMYLDGEKLFEKGKIDEAINWLGLPHAHFKNKGNNYGVSLCRDLLRKKGYNPISLELNYEENLEHLKNLEEIMKNHYTVSTN